VTIITITVVIGLGEGMFSDEIGVGVTTAGGRGVEVMMIGVGEAAGKKKSKIRGDPRIAPTQVMMAVSNAIRLRIIPVAVSQKCLPSFSLASSLLIGLLPSSH
jgi:hypothetical protein